jgi:hypothetical protein
MVCAFALAGRVALEASFLVLKGVRGGYCLYQILHEHGVLVRRQNAWDFL